MFIVIHCGGMPFDGETINSKSLGGSESSAYYMAKELAQQGHEVKVATNCAEQKVTDGVMYMPAGEVSEQFPLGQAFEEYAINTPIDILIIQRHPHAFIKPFSAKIKLWWVHDLALYRMQPEMQGQLANVDGILCVSQWHKEQVAEVYGLNPDIIYPITNGVDLSLFEGDNAMQLALEKGAEAEKNLGLGDILQKFIYEKEGRVKLLYTSRPERGLENLVKTDGIMERLLKIDPKFHLYVCAYDNVAPHMAQYYQMLWARIEKLPNCTNLGSLTKQELADVMRQCDLHVYPTEFEETSCITAMECMAAGLPMLTSEVGALPETTKGAGVILLEPNENGMLDIQKFVDTIANNDNLWNKGEKEFREMQFEAAKNFTWHKAANRLMKVIEYIFEKGQQNPAAIARHLVDMSDIYAANYYIGTLGTDHTSNEILESVIDEISECYAFMAEDSWDKHYEAYYEYEKNRGIDYGKNEDGSREDVSGNLRFEFVSNMVGDLVRAKQSDNSSGTLNILDYGCAHGHYTITLARRFPGVNFIGIDITQSNIDKAREWAKELNLKNVKFYAGEAKSAKGGGNERIILQTNSAQSIKKNSLDLIIAAEVIEHLRDYRGVVDELATYLKEDGTFVGTTPFGPWEAMGYKQHWPWRAHVHHFERADLKEAYGHHPGYKLLAAPAGSWEGQALGSYIWHFTRPISPSREIDYERKIRETIPWRQTVSLAMIVHNAESTIRHCLEHAMPMVDEVIIGVDTTTSDDTPGVIDKYMKEAWPEKRLRMFQIESPLKMGFDTARNFTLDGACGDWVLWLDDDEEIHVEDGWKRILRNNQFDAYAIQQHHFSIQPLGVMKTDWPNRLFRKSSGARFRGVVHEHPEMPNEQGIPYSCMIGNIQIVHPAYADEEIRFARFERNLPLLVRDREEHPDRMLGKMLWLRDLSNMCQWELKANGGHITQAMIQRADEGIQIFSEMLEEKEISLRMIIDALDFYSAMTKIKGIGFEFGFTVDSNKMAPRVDMGNARPIVAHFASREHLDKLMALVIDEKVRNYDSKYY